MNPKTLRVKLEQWTLENCGWGDRDYLGMSQLDRCPAQLYRQLTAGGQAARLLHALSFYDAQLHKADLIARLNMLGMWEQAPELHALDGRVRGHPDGHLVNENGRGVSVLQIHTMGGEQFENLLTYGYPRQAHYYQVQMYMAAGLYPDAMILYKCRETGRLWPVSVMAHRKVQRELMDKAARVLAAVDEQQPPACECGKCRETEKLTD